MLEPTFIKGVARGTKGGHGKWGGEIKIAGHGTATVVFNSRTNRRPVSVVKDGKTIANIIPVTTHAQDGWQILGSPHPEDAWLPDLSAAALRTCRRWLTAQT